MENKHGKQLLERQRRNMQFTEDRIELLDTIRELIDLELDRREMSFLKPKIDKEELNYADSYSEPSESPPSEQHSPESKRRSLWRRIVSILTAWQWLAKFTFRDNNQIFQQ